MANSEHPLARHSGGGTQAAGLAVTLLTLVLVQVGFGGGDIVHIINGALVDTDAYMRLNRVRVLWETGAWFDSIYPRINPPHGLVLHWTRPMDVLLLAGALPLTPFLGFEDALHWWGVLIGPLLQVAFLVALMWASAPLLSGTWRWLIALFSVAQPGILNNFVLGRPDHHGFLILLLVVLLGLTIRLLMEPERRRWAIGAGILSGLSLWVTLEALPQVLITLTALGFIWLRDGRSLLKAIFIYGIALLGAVFVAVVAEHGMSAFSRVEFDRLSAAHVILFGLNVAFWSGLVVLDHRREALSGFIQRALWALFGLAIGGALLWFTLPEFFFNPVTQKMENVYRAVHHSGVQQLQPVIDLSQTGWDVVARSLHWLGIAVFAIPWLIRMTIVRPRLETRAWVLIGLGVLVFLPAAILQVRWAIHEETFLLIPYTAFALQVMKWLSTRYRSFGLRIIRPLAVMGLCVWFLLPTVLAKSIGGGASSATTVSCPLQPLAAALKDSRLVGSGAKKLLAFIDFGPELLYRTPHAVLSIPTARRQSGFTSSYRIMTAPEPETALKRIVDNRIDLIVVCPGSAERIMYETGGETFYKALVRGEIPDFLAPVPLPAPLGRSFKVFAVRP